MLQVVLDTNVLVSAKISDGKPRTLLRKGISKEFHIVTSDLILRALGTVLRSISHKKRVVTIPVKLRRKFQIEEHFGVQLTEANGTIAPKRNVPT